jgi:hypothetical protein
VVSAPCWLDGAAEVDKAAPEEAAAVDEAAPEETTAVDEAAPDGEATPVDEAAPDEKAAVEDAPDKNSPLVDEATPEETAAVEEAAPEVEVSVVDWAAVDEAAELVVSLPVADAEAEGEPELLCVFFEPGFEPPLPPLLGGVTFGAGGVGNLGDVLTGGLVTSGGNVGFGETGELVVLCAMLLMIERMLLIILFQFGEAPWPDWVDGGWEFPTFEGIMVIVLTPFGRFPVEGVILIVLSPFRGFGWVMVLKVVAVNTGWIVTTPPATVVVCPAIVCSFVTVTVSVFVTVTVLVLCDQAGLISIPAKARRRLDRLILGLSWIEANEREFVWGSKQGCSIKPMIEANWRKRGG